MSLPPILLTNSLLLNASSSSTTSAARRPPPLRKRMPTSSGARSKGAPVMSPSVPSRSNTFFGDLPSPSSSSKGGPSASPKGQKPPFLSDRQMTVLGYPQQATATQKRSRAKSRLTTAAKMSTSNTDLSSNFSSHLTAPNKAKLTRVHSENKISDLGGRHRNLSDSNLAAGASLSRSFNRQITQTSKRGAAAKGKLASRNSNPVATAEAEAETDSDDEREGRIVEWLLGVEDADALTDQVVVEEPPRQTDTAIHIVYQGD